MIMSVIFVLLWTPSPPPQKTIHHRKTIIFQQKLSYPEKVFSIAQQPLQYCPQNLAVF